MNELLKKELRLLWPAWIAAVLLVVFLIILGRLLVSPTGPNVTDMTVVSSTVGLAIACVILGLAGFGREFSANTFALLLAQPRARKEFWQAKIAALFLAILPLALIVGLVGRRQLEPDAFWESAHTWLMIAIIALTGGLWTTLLFRQIVAAFWISVLLPFVTFLGIMNLPRAVNPEALATYVLLAYSIAGYLFARRQFLKAQDVQWTGGHVTLPGFKLRFPWKRTAVETHKRAPLLALIVKELRFQQVNFLFAGILAVAQVAVALLPKLLYVSDNSTLASLSAISWVLWFALPLLIGCSAVAEERKLGTLEPQLCLPFLRGWQFAVKISVTLGCALALGAMLPLALMYVTQSKDPSATEAILFWPLPCIFIVIFSFYASTLTRHILQALGAAIAMMLVGYFLGAWLTGRLGPHHEYFTLFDYRLWKGPLIHIVVVSVTLAFATGFTWRRLHWLWAVFWLAIIFYFSRKYAQAHLLPLFTNDSFVFGFRTSTLVRLAFLIGPLILALVLAGRNFQHVQSTFGLWRHNIATWFAVVVLSITATTTVYNRTWEKFMRFEPPAGPARLSGAVEPVINATRHSIGSPVFVLLPDGRLCHFLTQEWVAFKHRNKSQGTHPMPDGYVRPIKQPKVEFLPGSNWVSVAMTAANLVGVKSDGSLWKVYWSVWIDEQGQTIPVQIGGVAPQKGFKRKEVTPKAERIGPDTDWKSVAGDWSHYIALKQDGTIWGWGNNGNKQLGEGPESFTNGPVRIGLESDWVAVFTSFGHSFAVKRNGDVWKWGKYTREKQKTEDGPVKLNLKVPGVRTIRSDGNIDLILDTEGDLWGLGSIPPPWLGEHSYGHRIYTEPRKLGNQKWVAVRQMDWGGGGFVGLTLDHHLQELRTDPMRNLRLTPAQLGQRSDWIALAREGGAVLALSKDGTICRFGESWTDYPIARTRRITWSLNVLDAAN